MPSPRQIPCVGTALVALLDAASQKGYRAPVPLRSERCLSPDLSLLTGQGSPLTRTVLQQPPVSSVSLPSREYDPQLLKAGPVTHPCPWPSIGGLDSMPLIW